MLSMLNMVAEHSARKPQKICLIHMLKASVLKISAMFGALTRAHPVALTLWAPGIALLWPTAKLLKPHLIMLEQESKLSARSLRRPQIQTREMDGNAKTVQDASTALTRITFPATCVRHTAKRVSKNLVKVFLWLLLMPQKLRSPTTLEPSLVLQSPFLALLLPSLPLDDAKKTAITLNASEL